MPTDRDDGPGDSLDDEPGQPLEAANGSRRGRPRAAKSATAFRTISEVGEELNVPQHVLRFWETKFPQLRPLKRGGGRRYYRPEDLELLRRIHGLLYTDGYTIKGVQRLLKGGKGTALADDAEGDEADQMADEAHLPLRGVSVVRGPGLPEAEQRELAAELRALRDLLRS